MQRLLAIALAVAAATVHAQAPAARSVSLSGSMGGRALLVIDGQPRTLAPGASVQGVKLIAVDGNGDAQVEIDGKRVLLRTGMPVNVAGTQPSSGSSQIVLTAGLGGHFVTSGTINGRSVQFVVDTGATTVALGQAEADRIGLKYRDAPRSYGQTANGVVTSYRVTLDRVRVGEVEIYNVAASVLESPMNIVLLGNSFLTRFQMKRENDTLTLDRRP